MKEISSDSHDSILRDTVEAVKNISWETVRLELLEKMPTLMTLLAHITGKSSQNAPLLCLIGSMILKSQHQHMGLVQRAISVMMYGYGTSKQVNKQVTSIFLKHGYKIMLLNFEIHWIGS